MDDLPPREEQWNLLCEWIESENLRKHGLAVEAALRGYARSFEEDEEVWGAVGLLHDLDYEAYPEPPEHARQTARILREEGYPEVVVEAILSHADWTGVPRDTRLKKTLWACDELTGLVVATALVRPSKKIADVEVRSVMKKVDDPSFCRAIDRDHLREGPELLGLGMEEHVGNVLASMQGIADDLGL